MHKTWLGSYPDGVSEQIDVGEGSSLLDLFDQTFSKYSKLPAFSNMGKTITYAELDRYSLQVASYLSLRLNLKKGDRVAVMMPNLLQYPICLYGILRAGLVVVNVNPLYTPRELEHQLRDSGAAAIVILANFAHTLQQVLPKVSVKHVIVTKIGDMLPPLKGAIVNFVVKHVKKMIPPYQLRDHLSFKHLLGGNAEQYRKPHLSGEDIAFLQYTGGTTGVSKGAVLLHRNIVANIMQAREWIKASLTEGKETIVTPLPLYHIFSLTANCFIFGSIGGLNHLITNPKDIPNFIKEIKDLKFTAITGVNTLFNALLHHPEFNQVDFSQLKLSLGGGMALQQSVAEQWKKMTGCTLVEAYGLTETSPAAVMNPLNLKEFNGCIGLPISNTDISIRDDDGKELPSGEAGELWIKGPQVMQGYWQRPSETEQVIAAGWLKTGDIAKVLDDGYVKIVDRKKDMILVSGFNVYPNEIEDAVARHPGVLEVAAVGMPDEKSGEVVKLFVVKRHDYLTAAEIIDFCRKSLTAYKVPKVVEFRNELPKTNVGKILRRELRDTAPEQVQAS